MSDKYFRKREFLFRWQSPASDLNFKNPELLQEQVEAFYKDFPDIVFVTNSVHDAIHCIVKKPES